MKVVWEPIEGGIRSARLMRLRQASFAGPLHAHQALELTWIEQGEGIRIVGSRVEPFAAGDLVLVGPGLPHVWSSRGAPLDGVRATVLQVQPSTALAALPEWRPIAALIERARRGLALEAALRVRVAARLAAMPDTAGPGLLGEALAALGLLAEAEAEASLRPLDPLPLPVWRPDPGRQSRLDALLAWIRDHLRDTPSVEAAAAILHVSPRAFSRSFHRLAGKPFTEYVNDLRIAEACMLLRRDDRGIADIAARCGFGTLSHFNRQFRRRIGKTPREYRRLK